MRYVPIFLIYLLPVISWTQNLDQEIDLLYSRITVLEQEQETLESQVETLKLRRIQRDLDLFGLPALETGEEVIQHSAMSLVYDEEHEQAKWVAHIIIPDVITGNFSRSNDFRPDPKIPGGSAVEADYFLKYPLRNGDFEYDGFGYDRGHLAPSADFRWSSIAISESYFYSNMSPQVPELNREKWAELEGALRGYMYRNPTSQLYVVTGPVLRPNLPKVDRSINKVSIPETFFKVIVDLKLERGIGFLMQNNEYNRTLYSCAVSIDSVEQLTGIDFYHKVEDVVEENVEKQLFPTIWLPEELQGDVEPVNVEILPKNTFNTTAAKFFAGRRTEVKICGTVVSTKLTQKGHVFINLDRQFPNQVFTVAIWKDDRINFSYETHAELKGRRIIVEGRITESNGTPTMNVKHEKQITFYSE